jgi:hypothetical protein
MAEVAAARNQDQVSGIRGQGSEVRDQKAADRAWVPAILDDRLLDD